MGTNFNHPRGSIWRKWDLHVHTKDTVKNDQFTSVDFDIFCVTFFKKALEKEISVIGITDYFSIENYKKVKQFVSDIDKHSSFTDDEKTRIKAIFILPNVELRILPVTDSGKLVNIHCLFNPSFEKGLENYFFGAIKHSGGPGNKYPMNKQGLIDLGKSIDSSLINEDDQYKKGVDNFVVSHESLQNLIDESSDFRENTIIVVSNSSSDGASAFQKHYDLFEDCDSSSLDGVRKSIYCISQAIFSANENDRKYFLGQKKDCAETVKSKCGSIKPCIHGSDAHTEDELFTPDNERFCWIKADPNFEGLKQVIYEPDDRVRIQELKPEEKEDYQIIDRIKFIDDAFTPEEILLNQNLTTIIGGKSTGKSILLRNIAYAIDPNEVEHRLKEVGLDSYGSEVSDFRVNWRDGQESQKGIFNEVNKKIIYIPQSYLNRLVDKKEDKTSIDDIIKNVLEQEKDVKKVFLDLESSNREIEKNLTQDIESLFYKDIDIKEASENIKKIGDKRGIESEIEKLEKEISELKVKSGMSNEDITKYNELLKKINGLRERKGITEKDLEILNKLKSETLSIQYGVFSTISTSTLSEDIEKEINKTLADLKLKINQEWLTKINEEIKKIEKNKNTNDSEAEKTHLEFKPLLEQVQKSRALDEKIKKLDEQKAKLKIIISDEKNLEKLKLDYATLVKNLSTIHSKFYDELFNAKTNILKQRTISGELEFSIDIIPKNKQFEEEFTRDVCNLSSLSRFQEGFLLNDYLIPSSQVDFRGDITRIITGILDGEIKLKNSYSKKEAITRLVKNWFVFDYKIKQDGDEISEMSPGKKSFVFLKLLIELDNSKCPILLDQPEDDLDNRSIYNDLVTFIKSKKRDRQIIIATHNPNLVVGADAECVIVANQDGDKSKNNRYKFEYVQGSLENTFIKIGEDKILYKQGIQEHVCDILEGGKIAFEQRKRKYNI